MNKKEINRCFDQIIPSEKQKETMFLSVQNTVKEEIQMKKPAWAKFLAVAATITICIVTTALALNLGLHEKLIAYFNAEDQQIGLLEESMDSPEASISKHGITIKVLQTITDNFGVYVLYDMTMPEELSLSDEIVWHAEYLKVPLQDEKNAGMVGRNEILEQSAHHRIGLLSCFASSSPIVNGPIEAFFRDLGYWNADMEFVTLREGDWKLRWESTTLDSTMKFDINDSVSTNGELVTVTGIDISPISINITATQGGVLHAPIEILFQDGSQVAIEDASGTRIPGAALVDEASLLYEYQIYHRFDHVIDPNEVNGILLGGNLIALK